MNNSYRKLDKLFIPYDCAIKLKKMGYDEFCLAFHYFKNVDIEYFYCRNSESLNESSCCAITWEQAFDWFDEKFDLKVDCLNNMNREQVLSYFIGRVQKQLNLVD